MSAVERTVTGLGYDLVDVERLGGGLLRVTIDRRPGQAYTTGESEFVLVEDCEAVTRQLQYVLEVENADYGRLEVSSPGLDRPLRNAAHYARFAGQEIDITLKAPFQGRKKYRGELRTLEGEGAFRLVLPADRVPAKPGAKVSAKRLLAAASEDAEHALDFSLDEVREARLVPVVDFKGRRFAAPEAAAGSNNEVEGGRIR